MSVFEIISAIVLIIACVFLVVVVLVKDTKTQMSQTISGTSSDSYYQKNAGRTKEAMLNKATIVAAIIFFVLAIVVNLFNVYSGKKAAADEDSASSSVSDTADVSDTTDTAEVTVETADAGVAGTADTSSAEAENSSSASTAEATGENSSATSTAE